MIHDEYDEIISAYYLAREQGEPDALSRLCREYPQYEDRLLQDALLDAAVPAPTAAELAPLKTLITPELLERARRAIFAPATEALPVSLLQQAARLGKDALVLAREVDLPDDVLVLLDRRQIVPGSVPRHCLSRLAAALQTSVEALRAFLTSGPAAPAASFSFAAAPPAATAQQSFAAALEDSVTASPAQIAYWQAVLKEEYQAE